MNQYLQALLNAKAGDVVEVTLLGHAANVFLLDPVQFVNYQSGLQFLFYGGHATHTPVQVRVPTTGQWHLVVDLGGSPGTVSASYRVISG